MPLSSTHPSAAESRQNCPVCTLTSRLINTWSRNRLPRLPPSEQSAARSSCRWASQWERTKLAFVGHINCIPLKQNIAAPGVATGKVCEWHGITEKNKKKFTGTLSHYFFGTFFVSRVVGAWQDANSWSKAAQTKGVRKKGVVAFIWIFILF